MEPPTQTGVSPTRVLLFASDPLVRASFGAQLSGEGSVSVVGEAARATEVRALLRLAPETVLWDMGPSPGETAGGWAELPPVLALVTDERSCLDAIAHGARGALLREAGAAELVAGLRAVALGLRVFGPELLAERLGPSSGAGAPPEPLTPRERAALELLAEGLSNKAIAQRLSVSEHTAKFHVNAVLQKLGVERRTEAVVKAARLGLVVL